MTLAYPPRAVSLRKDKPYLRAVARVFAVAPTTVLGWLIEAADPLDAFSCYFLRDLAVE
jgi:hypothetical protein